MMNYYDRSDSLSSVQSTEKRERNETDRFETFETFCKFKGGIGTGIENKLINQTKDITYVQFIKSI